MRSLLGLTVDELKDVVLSLGLPAFTGKQIAGWLYDKKVSDIAQMTNLSKVARERLAQDYCVGSSAPVDAQRSVDGTVKYLYRKAQGDYIETVYIPDGDRATLCVSCQVVCKMGCKFYRANYALRPQCAYHFGDFRDTKRQNIPRRQAKCSLKKPYSQRAGRCRGSKFSVAFSSPQRRDPRSR